MAHVAVFGYGNPLRRDDAVGWRVADLVAHRWGERVVVRMGQQLVPEWSTDLATADAAYFVDASLLTRRRLRLRPLVVLNGAATLNAHVFEPADLVGLTQLLYGRAPPAFLLHLPAVDFDFGEGLSQQAATGVRRAFRLLNGRIRSLTQLA